MAETKFGTRAKAAFVQMEHLAKLSRMAIKKGDVSRAIEQIGGCIRLAHAFRGSMSQKRLLTGCAVTDHWRLGCCHAALGAEHHVRALGHLNVVRRYFKWDRKKRHLEPEKHQTAILCRALAKMAGICNLQGRHDLALLRAEEGLDALYRSEALRDGPAADLIQMLCFAARGDALRGLGHCGEVVLRHYEQVLIHYRRYVSAPGVFEERQRLTRATGDCLPWACDRLHPEHILKQSDKSLKEMLDGFSTPLRREADHILREQRVWQESGE